MPFFLLLFGLHCGQAQNYPYHGIPVELLENADAVLRLDELEVRLLATDLMVYRVKKVITVLNSNGDDYADIRLHYDKDKKVKQVEALLYDRLGTRIKQVKKRDFKDRAAVDGFSLYVDDRLLYHEHVPTQYPYTLEFTYEVETSDTGAFPFQFLIPAYGVSVEQSSFTIRYPPNVPKPVAKERNLDDLPVERLEEPGLIAYTAQGIPALIREPLSPPFREFAPWVGARLPSFHYKGYHAQVDDWQDMGLWLQEQLFRGRDELDPGRIRAIRTLVQGVEDPLEKAKIVYKYVQDNTRYVSVQMGIGGI